MRNELFSEKKNMDHNAFSEYVCVWMGAIAKYGCPKTQGKENTFRK